MPMNIREIGPLLERKVAEWAKNSDESVETVMRMVVESALAWFEDNGLKADIKCPVHEGQIHGGEAEELRKGVEEILKRDGGETEIRDQLQKLLDDVDARDSLAHGEWKDMVKLEARKEYIERFDTTRHDVLKAMGVKDLGKGWSWITGELTERHTWMVAARDREHQRDQATRRQMGVKLTEQREAVWKEQSKLETQGKWPLASVSVQENKRRVTADSFEEKLNIGDSVTILEQGAYRRGVVCAVNRTDSRVDTYDLVMVGKAPAPGAEEREEIRWEGWNAALNAIERSYGKSAKDLSHIPVAEVALRAVADMVKGFRHLTLMQKEFSDGK